MGLQKPGLYLPLFIDSKDGFIFSTSIPEIHSIPLQCGRDRHTYADGFAYICVSEPPKTAFPLPVVIPNPMFLQFSQKAQLIGAVMHAFSRSHRVSVGTVQGIRSCWSVQFGTRT